MEDFWPQGALCKNNMDTQETVKVPNLLHKGHQYIATGY